MIMHKSGDYKTLHGYFVIKNIVTTAGLSKFAMETTY